MARRAQLTRATIAKIESGGGNPTIETIDALSRVFQLNASELIRLAEVATCEVAATKSFKTNQYKGRYIRFANFEVYQIIADAGVRKESDPKRHENTAEICLVISGKVRVNVRGELHDLGPGMALRFKALHDHHFDIIEKAEFLLLHHSLV